MDAKLLIFGIMESLKKRAFSQEKIRQIIGRLLIILYARKRQSTQLTIHGPNGVVVSLSGVFSQQLFLTYQTLILEEEPDPLLKNMSLNIRISTQEVLDPKQWIPASAAVIVSISDIQCCGSVSYLDPRSIILNYGSGMPINNGFTGSGFTTLVSSVADP